MNVALALAVAAIYLSPLGWAALTSLRAEAPLAAYGRAWSLLAPEVTLVNTGVLATVGALLGVGSALGLSFALLDAGPRQKSALIGMCLALSVTPRQLTLVPLLGVARALEIDGTLAATVLATAAAAVPMHVVILEAGIRARCSDHLALFDLIGVRPIDRLLLLAPMVSHLAGALVVLEMLRLSTSFFLPLVLTLGRPDLHPLSVRLYLLLGMVPGDRPLQMAAVLLASAPALALLVVSQILRRSFSLPPCKRDGS